MIYNLGNYRYEKGTVYRIWLGFIKVPLFKVKGYRQGVRAINRLCMSKELLTVSREVLKDNAVEYLPPTPKQL